MLCRFILFDTAASRMKRSATQGETQAEGSPPTTIGSEQMEVAAKREKAHNMTAVCVGPVGSQSELSEKTLRIQNRRLVSYLFKFQLYK